MTATDVAGVDQEVESGLSAHDRARRGAGGRSPRLLPLISELFIITKDSELRRLGDILKPAQLDFIERCQAQLDTKGQIRAIVLKARQLGLSTIIEAIIFALSMLRSNMNSIVVSHEKDSAAHILGMTRNYWNTYVFKRWISEVYNGRSHLSWNNNSDIHIATARNTGAGRSNTLQVVHASEVAFWPEAEELMKGLGNAVPTFGLNAIFLESTANGVGNYFHKQWNRAVRGESEYEPFFYPWYLDPQYTADYIPVDVRDKYTMLQPLMDPEEANEEDWLRRTFKLDDGRLLWRRWHIANKCNGDLDQFHQEMPSTPHEAFVATGRNVFSLSRLLRHYQPRRGIRGKLIKVNNKVTFIEDPKGWLTIFSHPSDDKEWGVYLVGGDPTHAPGGDYACQQVVNRRTLEQVAVYRRKIDPITFGKDMQSLGTYYNMAMLAPEKEGPGYATVGCIVGDYYPYVHQTQHVDRAQGKPSTDVFGWSTNVKSKELAIAHLVKLISDPVVTVGNMEYGLIIHDEITLQELRDYVTSEKGLGYENSDGSEYDDGVMALAIAYAVHQIEPKPLAYEEVQEYKLPPRLAPIVGEPGHPVTTSGTARPIDNQPQDIAVLSDDDVDDSEAPWEAWGTPRERYDP